MGNCVFKRLGVVDEMVKVVTPNGGLMELYSPITAESITDEFPGYGLFLSPHRASPPLLHHENLCSGQYYYLLPLQYTVSREENTREGVPYRMSVDVKQGMLKRLSETEILPRYKTTGVWKVRLVINTDQLSEILSQEARTEELIQSVRTLAKCASGAPSAGNSDHQSWTDNHHYVESLIN